MALLLLAAVVILWLPGKVADTPTEPGIPAGETPVATAPARQPDTPLSTPPVASAPETAQAPFEQAREARLRQNAQDVLTPMLDAQFELSERGVEHWAPDAFNLAAQLAVDGDALYREREFEAAQAKYQAALDALQALQETIPTVLEEHRAALRTAIEQGDAAKGGELLEVAFLIAPDDANLQVLQRRLAQVPAVTDLRREAEQAEAGDALAQAINTLKQALALDAEHLAVAADLERLTETLRSRQYGEAMSAGYAALSKQRFATARQQFQQAAALAEASPEVTNALREVTEQETAYKLQQLARQGDAAEGTENWQAAVNIYENALAIDANVLFATRGLARSQPRAQLATQLNTLITDPKRLEDRKVVAAAQALLAQGRDIAGAGPKLQEQLRQLDTLLVQATTPVSVLLRSDQHTDVVVHRVANLGRFEQRTLTLRPGTYTAVGSRRGYRDVRQQFTVSHESPELEVTIICKEII